MKRLALLTYLAYAVVNTALAADQRIAFQRSDGVYIANLDASLVRKLTDGIFPAISPDGRFIAFTTVEGKDENPSHRLAVMEIGSGKRRLFERIPSDNSYCGGWSPDGNWIAFTMRTDDVWNLGIIKADGADFKLLRKGDQAGTALYSPCWARDGKSIFCHDITNIYRLALDGSIAGQWKIDKIVPNGSMSGDGRIDVSPDGHRLLLSVEMDEEYDRPDWDGPVPALWSFDLVTEVAVRLTAKNLFAWDGCWLDNINLLFVSQRPREKQTALYRTSGRTLSRLIEDVRRPTVSR